MGQRIPQAFVDEVLSRIDVVDVIGELVPLRKAGRNYVARCPFHAEKTPSFSVSQEKQYYHCFGCGVGGSAIKFLMEFSHLGFQDAVQQLAGRVGLVMPVASTFDQSRETATAGLYEVLARAAEFFQVQLKNHTVSARAVGYLRQRGLDGITAKKFGLGYAPPGWDNLLRELGSSATDVKHLEQAGLVVAKEAGGHYDRFRDRIMFPIHDVRGRVIGFGGRVLDKSEPKYLNSPETELFHKGSELYGLHQARQAAHSQRKLFIVEGYMDVIALAQHGVLNVVATLGTATTGEHIQRLFRSVEDLIFCFDGDTAGRRAAWRALEATLPLLYDGRSAGFLFLPTGEDPDSMIRASGPEFLGDGDKVVPLSEFLFRELVAQANPNTFEGKARFAQLAKPLVEKLPTGVLKELMLTRLGDVTGVAQRKHTGATIYSTRTSAPPKSKSELRQPTSLVRKAATLLVQAPQIGLQVKSRRDLEQLPVDGMPFLTKLIEIVNAEPNITCAQLVEKFRDTEEAKLLDRLAAAELSVTDPDAMAQEFTQILARIRKRNDLLEGRRAYRKQVEASLVK